MKKQINAIIYLFIFSALVFAQDAAGNKKLAAGMEAPTFSLPTLDQEYITLRDFCGKKLRKPWKNDVKHVVVVNFFATWCKPCMKEIPHLEKIKNDFKDLPVKFFLVDVGETREKLMSFLEKKDIGLTILLDRYQKVSEKYDARTLPRLFVIDKNGIIKKEQRGFSDPEGFENEMVTLLTELVLE